MAVTKQVSTALVMSASVLFVLVCSSTAVSVLRNRIPPSIRIITQLTIVITSYSIHYTKLYDVSESTRAMSGVCHSASVMRSMT